MYRARYACHIVTGVCWHYNSDVVKQTQCWDHEQFSDGSQYLTQLAVSMDAMLLRERKSRGSRAPVCDCRQMMLMSGGCRTTCCCNTSCIIQHARYTSMIQAFSSSRCHILQYSCTYRLLSEGYIQHCYSVPVYGAAILKCERFQYQRESQISQKSVHNI